MTFSEALTAMTNGKRVRRAIWHKQLCAELDGVYRLVNPTINKSVPYNFTPDDAQATDWQEYTS